MMFVSSHSYLVDYWGAMIANIAKILTEEVDEKCNEGCIHSW
jgi:hypothetical protein